MAVKIYSLWCCKLSCPSANYDFVVNLMMVMLTMISDDSDGNDATSDSVGNDFADWSNGP